MTNRFKVGDYVKITNDQLKGHGVGGENFVGKIARVEALCENQYQLVVFPELTTIFAVDSELGQAPKQAIEIVSQIHQSITMETYTTTEEEQEEEQMELKNLNKANIKEAKAQFDEENKNDEVEYAKAQLRHATDALDSIDRNIRYFEEQIKNEEASKKPYLEVIETFGVKRK